MKIIFLTLCFAAATLAQQKYDSVNDNFDISEVLQNERLLNSYSKCLLNKGPCTPEVKQVKGKFQRCKKVLITIFNHSSHSS